MGRELASTDEGGTSQDERSLLGDIVDAVVGDLSFIETVEVVEIEFKDIAVMQSIDGEGASFKRNLARDIRKDSGVEINDSRINRGTRLDSRIRDVNERNGVDGGVVGVNMASTTVRKVVGQDEAVVSEFTSTEIGVFVHIKPDTREGNLFVKVVEHFTPVSGGVGVEPIGPVGQTRPDDTDQEVRVIQGRSDPDVVVVTSDISRSGVVDKDTSIDNGDPVDLLGEFLELSKRETIVVNGEIGKVIHIINIGPDGVHGNAVVGHVGDNFGKVVQEHIAPSALMITVRPEGLNGPSVDVVVVHLDDGIREFVTDENLQFNKFAGHHVLQSLLFSIKVNIHGIGGSKVNHVPFSGSFSHHVNWVETISLLVALALINHGKLILVPEGVETSIIEEISGSFTETVHISGGQLSGKFNIIVTKDKIKTSGVKNSFVSGGSLDRNVKTINIDLIVQIA
jgi:hypothetical protein